jgi:putative transposase
MLRFSFAFYCCSQVKSRKVFLSADILLPFAIETTSGHSRACREGGLIFQSRRFRQACRDYRLQQKFITSYRMGLSNDSFAASKRSVWQHIFQTFEEARRIIRDWMQWYNKERPH